MEMNKLIKDAAQPRRGRFIVPTADLSALAELPEYFPKSHQ
jgi:hypothetical protein